MKDRIAKSVFWLVWSKGGLQALSMLTTLLVARLLSPSDYGLMALATVWTGAIGLMAELGLGPAIVQFRDVDERELNTFFWMTLSATVGAYAMLYAAAPMIAGWFESPRLTEVLRVIALGLPLMGLRQVPDALLRKRVELNRIAQSEIIATLSALPLTFALAWAGAGVWALVCGMLWQSMMNNVVLYWFVRWRPGLSVGSHRLAEILRFSLSSVGARVSWSVYEQVDVLVLGRFTNDHTLGFYSMARQLASMPVTKISVVVNQLASPVMAALQLDDERLRASFFRMVRLVGCVTVPLCLLLALEADDLVAIALGPKWIPMVPLLQILAAAGLLRWLEVLLPPVLFARYRAGFLFWWTMAVLGGMPFVFWAGASWKGAAGVALGWVVVYPVFVIWMARESLKELGAGWALVWEHIRPVARMAVISALCMLFVRWLIPGDTLAIQIARFSAAVAVGGAVYAGGLYLRGGRIGSEFLEVAGWVFRGRPVTAEKISN